MAGTDSARAGETETPSAPNPAQTNKSNMPHWPNCASGTSHGRSRTGRANPQGSIYPSLLILRSHTGAVTPGVASGSYCIPTAIATPEKWEPRSQGLGQRAGCRAIGESLAAAGDRPLGERLDRRGTNKWTQRPVPFFIPRQPPGGADGQAPCGGSGTRLLRYTAWGPSTTPERTRHVHA
jgi:hypothetical protein